MRMLRRWGKMKVNQHRSTRMSATVGTSSTLSCNLTRSERMRICSHAYIELFRVMYIILGTGGLFVRMLRSWEKMKVNQHRSTRMSGTVGTTSTLSCNLTRPRNTCGYVHTHIELFRVLCIILGTGGLLMRMLRSWGKMKVNQHRSTLMSANVGTSSTLCCTLTRPERLQICSHAYRTVQRYA